MKTSLKVLSLALALVLGHFAQATTGFYECTIQSFDGHYLTAVGGGGRVTDVVHTDATQALGWEKFALIRASYSNPMRFAIRTATGHYLTAVGGGGRTTDVLHSNATQLQAWEKFKLVPVGFNQYAIKTVNGNYLTAQDSGGRITDVIHSNATRIGDWEKFRINCQY